jgi:hypothetical protein
VRSLLARLIVALGFAAGAVAAFFSFRHAGFAVNTLVLFTYLSILIVVIAVMLNYPRLPRQAMVTGFADKLEAQGLLQSTSFRADRAFRVDGFEQQGPHYFIELEDGAGVLHLCGAYLYDYEPIDGALRHFPCTQFTVRRHAGLGYVVDLICGGLVIEPEVEAPPYSRMDFRERLVPEDGANLRDIDFDQLRHERTMAKTFKQ